jgi:hypothetical protein
LNDILKVLPGPALYNKIVMSEFSAFCEEIKQGKFVEKGAKVLL